MGFAKRYGDSWNYFLVALVLEMNVVLWVFQNAMVVGIMALVVIFQPELRNALEQLGRKKDFKLTDL